MWGLSLVAASGGHWGHSSSRCAGLSLSRPLLLRSTGSRHVHSVVVAHGPSCSVACGILPDQGSNPCPLHWQADSQPLRHQGSPLEFLTIVKWLSSFLTKSFALKYILSDINTAVPAFSWSVFPWYVFFNPFTFRLSWILFFYQSDTLGPLNGTFTLNRITDIFGYLSYFLLYYVYWYITLIDFLIFSPLEFLFICFKYIVGLVSKYFA